MLSRVGRGLAMDRRPHQRSIAEICKELRVSAVNSELEQATGLNAL
jgi:hypothetical protein